MAIVTPLLAILLLVATSSRVSGVSWEDCSNSAEASAYGPAFAYAFAKCLQTTCEGKTGDDLTLCVSKKCGGHVDVCNFLSPARSDVDGKTCCDFFGTEAGQSMYAGDAWTSGFCSVDACTPEDEMPEYVKCYDVLLSNGIQTVAKNTLALGQVAGTLSDIELCQAFDSSNGRACCSHVEQNPTSAVAAQGGFGQLCSYVSTKCTQHWLASNGTTTVAPADTESDTSELAAIFRRKKETNKESDSVGLAVGMGILGTVFGVGITACACFCLCVGVRKQSSKVSSV